MRGSGTSGQTVLAVLDRVIYRLAQAADQIAALVCAFLITATTFAVTIYSQGITIIWLDDLLRMLMIWLVYLGAVSLCFHGDHIAMDFVYLRFPAPLRRGLDIVIAVIGIALCGYVTKIGIDALERDIDYETLLPSGYLPAWPQSLAIPLCFALMTMAYASYLYSVLARRRQPGTNTDGPPAAGE